MSNYCKSFNRYMVECEYKVENTTFSDLWVLIDTWWNVNVLNLTDVTNADKVLIDTWWNVNVRSCYK